MDLSANPVAMRNSRTINDFYKNNILRIKQSAWGDTLMSWMIHSDYTLNKSQAQDLLRYVANYFAGDEETFDEFQDADWAITCCAGLVLESSKGSLTFFHHTVENYFSRTREQWFPAAEATQTEICCSYLLIDAFAEGPCQSDAEYKERLTQHPFYVHAAKSWGLHARKALDMLRDVQDTARQDRVRDVVMGLLERGSKVQAAVQALEVGDAEAQSSTGWSQAYPKEWTDIHLVVYFGLTEILEKLLPTDGIVWDADLNDTHSPFILAAACGHHSTLSFMLGKLHGGRGRHQGSLRGKAIHLALLAAAQNGHESAVRLLLTYGADPNGSDRIAPLSYAAEEGHVDVVGTLLEYGADPNIQDDTEGPLRLAIKNWNERIVTMLKDHGAVLDSAVTQVLDITDDSQMNTMRTMHTIETLLLREGAGINDKNEDGFTALHICAISGHLEGVELLLNSGADSTIMDNAGATPLDYALEGGYDHVVNAILDFRNFRA